MKKIVTLISIACICISTQSFSQIDSTRISTNITIEIMSLHFQESVVKLNDFLRTNTVYIEKQNEYKNEISTTFILNEPQYKLYEVFVSQLGYATSKEISTINNNKKTEEIEFEISYLKSQKKSYEDVLAKMTETSQQYLSTWDELKSIEERIFQKEQTLMMYKTSYNTYTVDLTMHDEIGTPSDSKVSFVNMPGFEYSYLITESPLQGLSAEYYQGYFIKYLFTKGKSYANIGAYKAIDGLDVTADSTYFSEMFLISFGQDFYSRYLGRGSKKFLNLYSSYSIGGMLATGETTQKYLAYITPSVGIELYKNKYLLIDTKASYFVPLASYNRNLRGLSANISFNFVF